MDKKDLARQILSERALDATTLAEIHAAQHDLREWIKQYPEERDWMRDAFEQLAQMEEIALLELQPSHSVSSAPKA